MTSSDFSNQLADAVQAAGAWTVRVQARRGPPASGIVLGPDLVLTADHVVDPARRPDPIGLPDGSEVARLRRRPRPSHRRRDSRVASARRSRPPARRKASRARAPWCWSSADPAASRKRQPRPGHRPRPAQRGPGAAACSSASSRSTRSCTRASRGGPLVDARRQRAGHDHQRPRLRRTSVAIPWSLVSQVAETHRPARQGPARLPRRRQPADAAVAARPRTWLAARSAACWSSRSPMAARRRRPASSRATFCPLDGNGVSNADDLQGLLGPNRVGSQVTAAVVRGGELTS